MKSSEYRRKSLEMFNRSPEESFKHGLNIALAPSEITYPKINPISDDFDLSSFNLEDFNNLKTKIDYFNSAFGKIHVFNIKSDKQIDILDNYSQFFIKIESDSNVKVVVNVNNFKEDLFSNFYFILEQNSNLEVLFLLNGNKNVFIKKISLNKNHSNIKWKNLFYECEFIRDLTYSFLSGKGSSCEYKSLYFSRDREKFDLGVSVFHNAENTKSDLLTRGVLDEKSNVLMRGLIDISENSSNSEGYEKQEALILSEDAKSDAIPDLKIKNHKVKCSHGSSIGKINSDDLFYLMSRGLSFNEAKQKIIEGYFAGFDEALVCKILGVIK